MTFSRRYIFSVIGLLALTVFINCPSPEPTAFHLAIAQIVEIQPIAELKSGFMDVFMGSEFAKNHHIRVSRYDAQNDGNLINQVADAVVASNPDLVFVLGTPLAQAIQKRSPHTLLVQGAVTDPVEAGLADSWMASGRRYVATSDLPPVAELLALVTRICPKGNRLGVLYNPGEANSAAVIARLRTAISSNPQYHMVERAVSKTSDVRLALESIHGAADLLIVPPDNTAYAALTLIGSFATERRLPLFATTSAAIDVGAVAVLSTEFVQLGRDSARLALLVLDGADPSTIPIAFEEHPSVLVSQGRLAALGLTLDSTALDHYKMVP